MPALTIADFKNLEIPFHHYPNFVETGTYCGDTILAMEPYFDSLYSVEIKHEFWEYAKNRYTGNKIEFILGDSSEELSLLCRRLHTPTLFFLDGHWSAGDTGKGKKDCPLYEELEAIVRVLSPKAVIIVDDVRLFGKGPFRGNEVCDWEDISVKNILSIVSNRLEKHYFLPSSLDPRDRLILHLHALA